MLVWTFAHQGGDFIAFVESDDWLEPDMYETLHDKMIKYKADIVNCGYYREYKKYREKCAIGKIVSIWELM